MRELLERQAGVVSRQQLMEVGLARDESRRLVRSLRWQTVHPGVYASFTGPVSDDARLWAALLHCGPGAAATRLTALRLWGLGEGNDGLDPIEVVVPAARRVVAPVGVSVQRSRRVPLTVHPVAAPPRVRLEVAVLDVADRATVAGQVIGPVLAATQRRLTTPGRLRAELDDRARHRWRALLVDLLAEAQAGVQSPLERRFLRGVEMPHGLPRGMRNQAESAGRGMAPTSSGSRASGDTRYRDTRYRDVRYHPWGLVVELDGRAAHPRSEAFRDWRRDNELVAAGDLVLRYGWHDVALNACEIAGQIAAVLAARGWKGRPKRCGASCALTP